MGAFKVKTGDFEFGIEPSPGRADTGNLEQDLPEVIIAVAEAAQQRNSAIALLLDEVQYLTRPELAALVVACHEIAQRGLPFMFIGAGLPQMAALAGNAKSYAERLFNYPQMGPLEADAAQAALVHPAEQEGVKFQDAAVEEILRATQGYPYFLQEWGFHVWNAASKSPIRVCDVQRITPEIVAHLDSNFFRVRFDRLTSLQQKYLRAMAELGPGPHKSGDVAGALGVEAAGISNVRQQLIDKGMIWSQRYGETAFTVPMFDTFMRRQMPRSICSPSIVLTTSFGAREPTKPSPTFCARSGPSRLVAVATDRAVLTPSSAMSTLSDNLICLTSMAHQHW
jgi:hypothetical protein